MPGRDDPENLRILKKSQLRLDHGCRVEFLPLRQRVGFGPLKHVVGFFSDINRQRS